MTTLAELAAEALEEQGKSLRELVVQKVVTEDVLKHSPKHPVVTVIIHDTYNGDHIDVTYDGMYHVKDHIYPWKQHLSPIRKFKNVQATARYLYMVCDNRTTDRTTYSLFLSENDPNNYPEQMPDESSVDDKYLMRREVWTRSFYDASRVKTITEPDPVFNEEEDEVPRKLTREDLEELLIVQSEMYL